MISKTTLEDLAIKGKVIHDTFCWWERTISEKAEKLNKLCEKEESTDEEIEQIEKLQLEIAALQRKGENENKILEKYQTETSKLLLNNLLSGVSALNLNYQQYK